MSHGETFYSGTLRQLAMALGGVVSGDQARVPGPGHSQGDDSLSIKVDGGKLLVHSFAGDDDLVCLNYVHAKLGLPKWQPEIKNGKTNGGAKPHSAPVARYVYRLADGTPFLRVDRLPDKGGFPQSHWTGEAWASGKPAGPKVPYRLTELLAAPLTAPVLVVEGEKDADKLAKQDLVVTCNSEGADNGSGGKWTPDLNPYFKDRDVYIIADNDDAGRKHANHVARNLYGIAASVRVVQLPGLPPKGDASDFLKNDPTGTRLVRECKSAPLWEPATPGGAGAAGTGDDQILIDELAALPLLEYEKAPRRCR